MSGGFRPCDVVLAGRTTIKVAQFQYALLCMIVSDRFSKSLIDVHQHPPLEHFYF